MLSTSKYQSAFCEMWKMHSPCLTLRKIKAQRAEMTCFRSHSTLPEPGIEPKTDSQCHAKFISLQQSNQILLSKSKVLGWHL